MLEVIEIKSFNNIECFKFNSIRPIANESSNAVAVVLYKT